MIDEWVANTKKFMWPVIGTYLIIYLFQLNIQIWGPILTPVMPHAATSTSSPSLSGDEQVWRLDGREVTAHHLTSTAPDIVNQDIRVTGYNAAGEVIWARGGIRTMVRIK